MDNAIISRVTRNGIIVNGQSYFNDDLLLYVGSTVEVIGSDVFYRGELIAHLNRKML